MKLCGLQKLTLLDYPGRMACTVFTGGCNFRCPFCHNASLVVRADEAEPLGEADFFSFLHKRAGILEGVCVTGGEPLLWPDLPAFLARIHKAGFLIKLDTNGSFPDRLRHVVEEGLVDMVAMDLKNCPARYAETAGVSKLSLAAIAESKDYLLSGPISYEFRTTVVKGLHTCADIEALAAWIVGARAYYLQGFVDSGDVLANGLSACSKAEMEQLLLTAQKYVPCAALRGM